MSSTTRLTGTAATPSILVGPVLALIGPPRSIPLTVRHHDHAKAGHSIRYPYVPAETVHDAKARTAA
jgi:hypothetical protein